LDPASLVRDVCDAPVTDILVSSPFSLTPVPGSPTIMPLTEVETSNRVGRDERHALPLLFFPIDTQ